MERCPGGGGGGGADPETPSEAAGAAGRAGQQGSVGPPPARPLRPPRAVIVPARGRPARHRGSRCPHGARAGGRAGGLGRPRAGPAPARPPPSAAVSSPVVAGEWRQQPGIQASGSLGSKTLFSAPVPGKDNKELVPPGSSGLGAGRRTRRAPEAALPLASGSALPRPAPLCPRGAPGGPGSLPGGPLGGGGGAGVAGGGAGHPGGAAGLAGRVPRGGRGGAGGRVGPPAPGSERQPPASAAPHSPAGRRRALPLRRDAAAAAAGAPGAAGAGPPQAGAAATGPEPSEAHIGGAARPVLSSGPRRPPGTASRHRGRRSPSSRRVSGGHTPPPGYLASAILPEAGGVQRACVRKGRRRAAPRGVRSAQAPRCGARAVTSRGPGRDVADPSPRRLRSARPDPLLRL
ncbi:collagen alpha-1(I) chain-like [Vulpes lagopus]|uniref:collagen alpha-1(I) chain-like n=1 Tax=Vulpes lagopus TaxID=494514 RepID=UPI001BC8E96B|nr:collagen alpha-1(I) chain-like [Vulpes lagopus]